jgi:hypothetical protein
VLNSQGAFVAGNTRRTVRRTPTNRFGFSRRSSWPSGHGRTRLARIVVVHSDHFRVARFARLQLAATSAAIASRVASSPERTAVYRQVVPDQQPERRSKGGSTAAARRSKLLARRWSSGHPTAGSDGQ